jgi:transcriptional regulator with XRE-family HTH domain
MEQLARLRKLKGYSQRALAKESGVSPATIYELENGRRRPNPSTLRKLAQALEVEVADLLGGEYPKEPSLSLEPTFNDVLEEERRAVWEAAADNARRLRDTGQAQMWKALSEWRASKQRGEPYAARREYLDEMGDLLQEVYGAYTAVGDAYIEAALTQGGSSASVPSYLREESRAANDFYVELFGLVRSAGLGIRTGDDAAAKRAAKAQPEGKGRPHEVEEPAA